MPSHLARRLLPLSAVLALGVVAILPASGTVPREVEGAHEPPVRSVVEVDIGAMLPSAPDLDPLPAEPTLEDIRLNMAAGDTGRALRIAERYLEQHRWGRDRDAVAMVVGMLHREAGRPNMASEAFTRIRGGKGPLAEWGAFYEAEQDLVRGRQWVAIRECEKYQKTYPDGRFDSACRALIARAHADLGRFQSARGVAVEYDEDHELAEIGEQIELRLARWLVENDPADAVDNLQKLALDHDSALTGRVAEELIAQLAVDGVEGAAIPDDTESLKRRAISLRRAKRMQDAWAVYQDLVQRSEDDAQLTRWVEDQAEVFGWRTRNWDFLADWYQAEYDRKPDAEMAWNRYRVLERSGRFDEAMAQAKLGLEKHGGSREWRRKEEAIARTFLLGKDYIGARDLLDTVAARGGWTGRRARFYAAFSAHMAGEHEDAVTRLTAIVDRNRSYRTEAHYWRAKAWLALEKPEEAQADVDWILENEPHGWYALLTRQGHADQPRIKPFLRDGTWPGPDLPPPPQSAVALTGTPIVPIAAPVKPQARSHRSALGSLSWPLASLVAPLVAEPHPVVLTMDPVAPPPSYQAGTWFDPDAARGAFYRFAKSNGDVWTSLPAIYDLARVGLYDLSGPLMSEMFEDWREARTRGSHPRYAAARQVYLPTAKWRELFLFARDHHHSARFTYDMWEDVEDEELALEAWRLAYPLAHDRLVWGESRKADIDPYLVLGLMRQESTYNAIAVSRVGARGAMQIMPRTGHLLADLAHDTEYTARDLEDPTIAVGYGISYLGLLMKRFEGAYPLAIASYNGGPHNMSYWLEGTGSEMPMDAFVEHIPFRETRDYVKKVSSGYARYLALHAPEGTEVVLPTTPRGDHPDIVDF